MKALTMSLILLLGIFVGCSESGNSTSVGGGDLTIEDSINDSGSIVDTIDSKDTPKDDLTIKDSINDSGSVVDTIDNDSPKVSTSIDTITAINGYIIFDNFENDVLLAGDGETNPDNQTDLGAMFNYYTDDADQYYNGGYWYAFDDKDNDGTSSAVPNYVTDKEFESGLAQEGYDGSTQSLHINITLGEGADYPFYGIGANIRGEGEYFDFSKMESLEFFAKGSGKMKVILKTRMADVDYASDWGDFSYDFTLDSNWTKYTIKTSDFVADKYSELSIDGVKIEDAIDAVGKIHFQTSSNLTAGSKVDFYVDNIMIKASSITLAK